MLKLKLCDHARPPANMVAWLSGMDPTLLLAYANFGYKHFYPLPNGRALHDIAEYNLHQYHPLGFIWWTPTKLRDQTVSTRHRRTPH